MWPVQRVGETVNSMATTLCSTIATEKRLQRGPLIIIPDPRRPSQNLMYKNTRDVFDD